MKKVNSFTIIFLVLLIVGQILAKPTKKVLVTGFSRSGKSTFCNFLCSSFKFKPKANISGATQIFQTEQIELKDYTLIVTDTPGFTDQKQQNNWYTLIDIVDYIKEQQVDFVVIVINSSIRAANANEEFILKWLRYTLPLNKQNSLILINHHREFQEFSFEDEDESDLCQNEEQENNKNFMNFMNNTFTNSTIEIINYNTDKSKTIRLFKILTKKLKEEILPLAQFDYTKIQDLQQKIEIDLQSKESICMNKLKKPEEENYQTKINQLDQEAIQIIEEQKTLQNLVNNTTDNIDKIIKSPNYPNVPSYSRSQVDQINSLQDEKCNTKLELQKKQMVEQQIKEKLEKLQEEYESFVQKIPQLKEFESCLQQANNDIQEMMEVQNYFKTLNPSSKQNQHKQ
ncbi:50S ribosome-binding GTPase (macronuclear) [Tetrahymena thermophila SB210]|uniref:50S ribosome-binding GTPase n=1 Tax=Tetrahymena thermophila (strain SB210) TaxID=312017 RepID=Q23LQ4_TETTS|nr:50S ribosome-binding GTPase [Tetrahymena thermophila SB210]EAR97456.1 50S ribosome-binding GTPase [Tetrahymena thermophila SB210]|eukprot:XP_001017701.1 50S ribosome-binding GTPase [Tetrahymena thermophila SB210]